MRGARPVGSALDGKELLRGALWSDPQPRAGRENNSRGAGGKFGPDVVREFLATNSLCMVVRSHECVNRGFDLPFDVDKVGSRDE